MLNLGGFDLTSEEIHLIVEKCTNLKELSIDASNINWRTLEYLVQKLPANIHKLGLMLTISAQVWPT